MPNIFDHLRQAAKVAASCATSTIPELDRQIAEMEEQKEKIEVKRLVAHDALERATNYPVKRGADYLCPLCWVSEGKMSPLRSVPGRGRDGIFGCGKCHYEDAFAP